MSVFLFDRGATWWRTRTWERLESQTQVTERRSFTQRGRYPRWKSLFISFCSFSKDLNKFVLYSIFPRPSRSTFFLSLIEYWIECLVPSAGESSGLWWQQLSVHLAGESRAARVFTQLPGQRLSHPGLCQEPVGTRDRQRKSLWWWTLVVWDVRRQLIPEHWNLTAH